MLTGWQTEQTVVTSDDTGAATVCKILSEMCKPQIKEDPIEIQEEVKEHVVEEVEEDTGKGKKDKKSRESKSAKMGKKGAAGDATPARSQSVLGAGDKEDPSTSETDKSGDENDDIAMLQQLQTKQAQPHEAKTPHAAYIDASFATGSVLPEGCGMNSQSAQPVRVLGCFYTGKDLVPNPADLDSWVVKCSSHDMLYQGKLQYDNRSAWTKTMQAKLGICLETEHDVLVRSRELRESGEGHVALQWHMYLKEFCGMFQFLRVHHDVSAMQTIIMESSVEAPGTTLRYVPDLRLLQGQKDGGKDSGKGADVAPNFSNGQPHYFHVDSLHPARVLFTLGVAPAMAPRYPGDQPNLNTNAQPPGTADSSANTTVAATDASDALEVEPERRYERTILPESGAAIVENFSWRSVTDPDVTVDMYTTGTVTKVVVLPPGRHVFRIITDCTHSSALLVSSDVEMILGEEEDVITHLDGSSVRLQSHVALACQALQIMFLNSEKAEQVVGMVAATHYQKFGPSIRHIVAFWDALRWALRTTFASDWKSGEDLSADAIAWTQVVVHLRHLMLKAVRSIDAKARKEGKMLHKHLPAEDSQYSSRQSLLNVAHMGSKVEVLAPALSALARKEAHALSRERGNEEAEDNTSPTPTHPATGTAAEDQAQTERENKASFVIQGAWAMYMAKINANRMRLGLINENRTVIAESWEKISANIVEFGVLFYRRQFELDRSMLSAYDFGADEQDRAKMCDLRGTMEEKPANQWFVLFKEVFAFKEVTEALAQLRVSLPPPAEGQAPVAPEVFQLAIINNDTLELVPSVFGKPLPHKFAPNQHGYTFIASGRSPVPVPGVEWSLRVLSYPDFPYDEELPIKNGTVEPTEEAAPCRAILTPGSAAEEIDPLTGEVVLKYDVLFRYKIKIASEQEVVGISLSVDPVEIPDGVLHLELFEDGVQMACETVKHCVILPFIRLKGIARPESAQAEDDTKGKGKGKDKDKRSKSAKKRADSTASKRKDTETSEGLQAVADAGEVGPTYTVVGRILSGAPPAVIEPKVGDVPPAATKKKDKKKPKSAGGNDGGYPQWKFRIFSETPDRVMITPDHTREDEINSKKVGWEAVEEGRSNVSTQLREDFLGTELVEKAEEDSTAPRVPATILRAIHVPEVVRRTNDTTLIFGDEYQNVQDTSRFHLQKQYKNERDSLLSQRSTYSARRREMNSSHISRYSSLRTLRNQSLTTKEDLRAVSLVAWGLMVSPLLFLFYMLALFARVAQSKFETLFACSCCCEQPLSRVVYHPGLSAAHFGRSIRKKECRGGSCIGARGEHAAPLLLPLLCKPWAGLWFRAQDLASCQKQACLPHPNPRPHTLTLTQIVRMMFRPKRWRWRLHSMAAHGPRRGKTKRRNKHHARTHTPHSTYPPTHTHTPTACKPDVQPFIFIVNEEKQTAKQWPGNSSCKESCYSRVRAANRRYCRQASLRCRRHHTKHSVRHVYAHEGLLFLRMI